MYAWLGTVGLIKPTFRVGSLERFIRLMPDGVGVIPRYVGVRAGTATGKENISYGRPTRSYSRNHRPRLIVRRAARRIRYICEIPAAKGPYLPRNQRSR